MLRNTGSCCTVKYDSYISMILQNGSRTVSCLFTLQHALYSISLVGTCSDEQNFLCTHDAAKTLCNG